MATVAGRLVKGVADILPLAPGVVFAVMGAAALDSDACQCAVVAVAASALLTSFEGDNDDFAAVNREGVIGLALLTHLFCIHILMQSAEWERENKEYDVLTDLPGSGHDLLVATNEKVHDSAINRQPVYFLLHPPSNAK